MLRTLICTAALIVIAATAQVEAGGFKVKFGGGKGHHNHHRHNNYHGNHHKYHNHTYHYGYQKHHYVKPYHAPVQYYQVCYHCDAWGYHKYHAFTCPKQAAAYVVQLQTAGYYANVAPTHEPYANGHIIYKQEQYNHWMP